MNTEQSEALATRLRASLPGGDTRSATFYHPYPIAFDHGSGCRVVDVDGNSYLDFWNNYTSLAHGHAHPRIVEAIVHQARRGTAFPAPNLPQADLAERIRERVESVDLLRYTNSGSEAVMLAVRAARAVTGRELIVKADGGYHGCWEQVPMTSDPTLGSPAGTPDAVNDLIAWCVYNDLDSLRSVMAEVGGRAACVILEPVMTGAGVIVGEPAFFEEARRLCDEHGALLILDEVVTLRLDFGGYQAVLGVDADLTTFGKIIGGGLPVGATGGRTEIMERFDPRHPGFVGHSGTFNGNPLTAVAGCASLDLLDEGEIVRINSLGAELASRLSAQIDDSGLGGTVTNIGSLVQVHFETGGPVRSFADTNMTSPLLTRIHRAALERGLLFAARGLLCTSTAMDDAVIDEAVAAFAGALAEVAGTLEAV